MISVLLVAVDVCISFVVIRDIKRQDSYYLSNMAQLYIQEQNETFFKLSRKLLSILMGNEGTKLDINDALSVLETSTDPLEVNVATTRLRSAFLEYTWDYGTDYQFFAFLKAADRYVNLNSLGQEEPGMEAVVRELLEEGILDTYSAKAKWTCIRISSGNYILKVMENNGRYLGCYLRASALLGPLEKLDFTEYGFCVLADGDNRPVTDFTGREKLVNRYLETRQTGLLSTWFVIEKSFDRAPFAVLIFIDNMGIYGKFLVIQAALVALGASILAVLIFIMRYIRRRVLRPIQEFADNLLSYDDSDGFVFDITSNELKELELANEQFRNLLRQIKRLKITLYENELKRQKIQNDYLQLQIKPHFYLNCLNFIYQMVELGYDEDAKRMASVTSDYLRYLFQSSMDLTELKSELEHVRNYLEIQKMRYKSAFSYYIEQDEETAECRILPLMIQTFAENSVKHTVSLDEPVEITILVCAELYRGGKAVHISISDTGKGFPADVLERLNRGEALEQQDGHRIGITNCLTRMRYFYGDGGSISFYNNPVGGAVVDMYLPAGEDGRQSFGNAGESERREGSKDESVAGR